MNTNDKLNENEKPPFFKSWKGWYFLVLGNLAFLIILFYLFTKVFE
ncbi:MAG: hypothetical protein IH949_06340 [Bacteroidetes bacterium]|nr:hypothetical protein [Bacteroidota bacterium]